MRVRHGHHAKNTTICLGAVDGRILWHEEENSKDAILTRHECIVSSIQYHIVSLYKGMRHFEF